MKNTIIRVLAHHIWQVGHHMGDDLEAAVLGQLERVANGCHCVTAIGVPGHVLVHTLHADLDTDRVS
jgi:hypothetical protein